MAKSTFPRTPSERTSLINSVVATIEAENAQSQIKLHESFKTELVNYSRHVKVNDLSEEDLRVVLTEICRRAIKRTKENRNKRGVKALEAPGEDVRKVIMQLCSTWEDCFEASTKILESMHVSAGLTNEKG